MNKRMARVVVPERVYACKDPQVGPHNRCRHPEAMPPGYTQCLGDPGCAVRVRTHIRRHGMTIKNPNRLCFWHAEDGAIRAGNWEGRMNELMGVSL